MTARLSPNSTVHLRSYLLPVINHYLLYFGLARCQRAEGLYRMPTHPYWHRNGSDEANAMWVPGRDGVQPLETEVRVRPQYNPTPIRYIQG